MPSAPAPIDPAALRRHYSAFLAPGRLLLTGHSHQAWPDVARDGLLACFQDAATHADDKWALAAAQADRVRGAVAAQIGGSPADVALAANTHELVVRLLSALDWRSRRHLVTTSGEFHTISRQTLRLAEAGVEVTVVDAAPVETLAERVAAALRPDTAVALVSAVLFRTGAIVPRLGELAAAAERASVPLLLDAYHAFMATPIDWPASGEVYIVGGGYKYAQWGEGVGWMVVPAGCERRPVATGWFSDLDGLAEDRRGGSLSYGQQGGARFAGATYDPASHYRAAAVIELFGAEGLTLARLRALSVRQCARLRAGLSEVPLAGPEAPSARGGFLAFDLGSGAWPSSAKVIDRLRRAGVVVDARGSVLRLGPAPYLTDGDLDRATAHVRAALGLSGRGVEI